MATVRVSLGVLVSLALLVATTGSTPGAPLATKVIRWSPFDSAGTVKTTLKVEFVRKGVCVDIGYTYVGGIAYRCRAGNGLYNACWRQGPSPTEFVICTWTPGQNRVVRLRSRHLLLYPGVTYARAARFPWVIELIDGNRCTVVQGAHDSLSARGRRFTVDYGCERGNLVLLREGLRRGRLWTVKAARYVRAVSRYRFLGDRSIRRVYFGTLPRSLARQHELARQAVAAAKTVIRRRAPRAQLSLVWVRLALPGADWAHVIFAHDAGERGWFAVLRRVDAEWRDASAYKPYCTNLPRAVRRQLFLSRTTWNPPPDHFLAPTGEQRC